MAVHDERRQLLVVCRLPKEIPAQSPEANPWLTSEPQPSEARGQLSSPADS